MTTITNQGRVVGGSGRRLAGVRLDRDLDERYEDAYGTYRLTNHQNMLWRLYKTGAEHYAIFGAVELRRAGYFEDDGSISLPPTVDLGHVTEIGAATIIEVAEICDGDTRYQEGGEHIREVLAYHQAIDRLATARWRLNKAAESLQGPHPRSPSSAAALRQTVTECETQLRELGFGEAQIELGLWLLDEGHLDARQMYDTVKAVS